MRLLENQNDSGTGDSSQGKKRQKTSWMKALQRHPGGMREFLGGSFGDWDCLDKEAKAEHHRGQENCTVQQGNACEAEGLRGGRDSDRGKCSLAKSLICGFTAQRRKE